MNLSKQTSDAIQMLACCYRAGDELVKVANIADELGLTKQMALKLANILSQAELVETFRGPSGGIRLSEATRDAMLGEIVRRLESAPTQKSVIPHG
ncbi:MAG: Rrf2 family transcriptional regulator, partial [Pseudomonadota bacterium]